MGKGGTGGGERKPRELVALVEDRAGRRDPQRLVGEGEGWESAGEERSRISISPLHIGVGLALVAVAVIVPVTAAGLTWLAFRRSDA